jgi:hypothetical protein
VVVSHISGWQLRADLAMTLRGREASNKSHSPELPAKEESEMSVRKPEDWPSLFDQNMNKRDLEGVIPL